MRMFIIEFIILTTFSITKLSSCDHRDVGLVVLPPMVIGYDDLYDDNEISEHGNTTPTKPNGTRQSKAGYKDKIDENDIIKESDKIDNIKERLVGDPKLDAQNIIRLLTEFLDKYSSGKDSSNRRSYPSKPIHPRANNVNSTGRAMRSFNVQF